MFADIEQRIIGRLQERLGPDVFVASADTPDSAKELRQRAPAVWVVYEGHDIGADIPNVPGVQQLILIWSLVIQTRSAKGNGGALEARKQASDLIVQIIESLLGMPVGAGRVLRLEPSEGSEYSAGFSLTRMRFSAAVTFRGKP